MKKARSLFIVICAVFAVGALGLTGCSKKEFNPIPEFEKAGYTVTVAENNTEELGKVLSDASGITVALVAKSIRKTYICEKDDSRCVIIEFIKKPDSSNVILMSISTVRGRYAFLSGDKESEKIFKK